MVHSGSVAYRAKNMLLLFFSAARLSSTLSRGALHAGGARRWTHIPSDCLNVQRSVAVSYTRANALFNALHTRSSPITFIWFGRTRCCCATLAAIRQWDGLHHLARMNNLTRRSSKITRGNAGRRAAQAVRRSRWTTPPDALLRNPYTTTCCAAGFRGGGHFGDYLWSRGFCWTKRFVDARTATSAPYIPTCATCFARALPK